MGRMVVVNSCLKFLLFAFHNPFQAESQLNLTYRFNPTNFWSNLSQAHVWWQPQACSLVESGKWPPRQFRPVCQWWAFASVCLNHYEQNSHFLCQAINCDASLLNLPALLNAEHPSSQYVSKAHCWGTPRTIFLPTGFLLTLKIPHSNSLFIR